MYEKITRRGHFVFLSELWSYPRRRSVGKGRDGSRPGVACTDRFRKLRHELERSVRLFSRSVNREGLGGRLDRRPETIGKLVSRKLAKSQNAQSLPGAPDGNYVVMQFDTSFANKKSAVETVTFIEEKDGKWKAAGYYIK